MQGIGNESQPATSDTDTRKQGGRLRAALGTALAIYTTALTMRRQASADKSNHIHRPPNPLIRLFSLLPTAAIDHGLYSLSLLEPASPLRFYCLFLSIDRPKTEIPNRLGNRPSNLQPMLDASQLSVLFNLLQSPAPLFSPAHVSRQSTVKHCFRSMLYPRG